MTDALSILSANYLTVGSNVTYSKTKYVDVNPTDYQGSWTGKYGNGKAFTVQVSNVSGFKANVKYQSGDTTNFSEVLIKDSSFRIGDSKFTLATAGTAVMSTVITDPVTGGTSVMRAYATQK